MLTRKRFGEKIWEWEMGPKSILAKKSDWGIPRPPRAAMGACRGCSLAWPGTGHIPARTVYRCTSMVVHHVGGE